MKLLQVVEVEMSTIIDLQYLSPQKKNVDGIAFISHIEKLKSN